MRSLGSSYYLGYEIAIFWEPNSGYMAEVSLIGGHPLVLFTRQSYKAVLDLSESYINDRIHDQYDHELMEMSGL